MNIEDYFISLSEECRTLKDRVRMLIKDQHWPTDGEWKESVLRNMIRRSAPNNLTIGRGFVVDHDRCSAQIDVLVYDNTFPVLYREGDLVFVTPSSCRAIIEVKSRLNATQFKKAAEKLADDAEFIRQRGIGIPLFTGLFSYEIQRQDAVRFLQVVQEVSRGSDLRIIDHVAIGESLFIKFWHTEPSSQNMMPYDYWHLYNLGQMSFGYFIHNLLAEVTRDLAAGHKSAWFPKLSKEVSFLEKLPLAVPNQALMQWENGQV